MSDATCNETEPVVMSAGTFVGENGVTYEVKITGTAEVTRGPLGRFLDLAEEIRGEGLEVPEPIAAVLHDLSQP